MKETVDWIRYGA